MVTRESAAASRLLLFSFAKGTSKGKSIQEILKLGFEDCVTLPV